MYLRGCSDAWRFPGRIGYRWGFELAPSSLAHIVIKVNEVHAACKWSARSDIPVIKVLLQYIAWDMVMERDRDDLMARHVPTLPLMTSDAEPAHTRLGFYFTFIIYSKEWKWFTLLTGKIYIQYMPFKSVVFNFFCLFFSTQLSSKNVCVVFYDLISLNIQGIILHWE